MGFLDDVVRTAAPIIQSPLGLTNAVTAPFTGAMMAGGGGGQPAPIPGYAPNFQANAQARRADYDFGKKEGRELFYDDPDAQMARGKYMDLAQGYSGQELGALKQGALGEVQGQRAGYLRDLSSNLAKSGVGGARAAAMKAGADEKFLRTTADNERKILLDSAGLKRQGTKDFIDYTERQKYGQLASALGQQQLGVADRSGEAQASAASAAAAQANNRRQPGVIGQIFDSLF